MEEMQFGPGTVFLGILMLVLVVVGFFFSGMPPIPVQNKNPSEPPSEIKIYNKGGALLSELWIETSLNRTSRIYFRVFHSGQYPQIVSIGGVGNIATNCAININPALSWVMQAQTYQDVEVAATPLSALGIGEFRIRVVTSYEGE